MYITVSEQDCHWILLSGSINQCATLDRVFLRLMLTIWRICVRMSEVVSPLGWQPNFLCTFHNFHACCTFYPPHPSQLDGKNMKKAENIVKRKDLTTEIQHAWNVKTKVIPVKTRTTGSISKSFRKYLSNTPGQHEIKELLTTNIFGTAHM